MLVLAAALLMLHGCGTTPQPEAAGKASAPSAPPPRPSALRIEQQWLQSWFEGTPVRIAQQGAEAIVVEVPLEFSFDSGRSKVLPPLAAVLDKLSLSLRRRPDARLDLVAAPGDDAAGAALALQRAEQVRRHLLASGVSTARLAKPSASTTAAVRLRMEIAAH